MYIRELVEKHGLGIWVFCKKTSYPPFQVVECLNADDQGRHQFKVCYGDGHESIIVDCLDDYSKLRYPG